jgi:RNA polymerase sigma-70 factor (ECF subfamily)
LRRQRRHREINELYSAEVHEAYEPAQTVEQYTSLKDALDQLSAPDRAILSLRYEEEFDTAEIAAILTIPEGTVKSRLFYARKRLRAFLENSDD